MYIMISRLHHEVERPSSHNPISMSLELNIKEKMLWKRSHDDTVALGLRIYCRPRDSSLLHLGSALS